MVGSYYDEKFQKSNVKNVHNNTYKMSEKYCDRGYYDRGSKMKIVLLIRCQKRVSIMR